MFVTRDKDKRCLYCQGELKPMPVRDVYGNQSEYGWCDCTDAGTSGQGRSMFLPDMPFRNMTIRRSGGPPITSGPRRMRGDASPLPEPDPDRYDNGPDPEFDQLLRQNITLTQELQELKIAHAAMHERIVFLEAELGERESDPDPGPYADLEPYSP